MIGRTPVGISTLRPLSHGVIADFEMTRHMIRHYMSRAGASGGVFRIRASQSACQRA